MSAAEGAAIKLDAANDANVEAINLVGNQYNRWGSAFVAFDVSSARSDIATLTISGATFDREKPVYAYSKSGLLYRIYIAGVDASGNITIKLDKYLKDGATIGLMQPEMDFDFTVTPSVTELVKKDDSSSDYEITCTFNFMPRTGLKDDIEALDSQSNLGVEFSFCDKTWNKDSESYDAICQLARGGTFSDTFTIHLSDEDFERGFFSAYAQLRIGVSHGGTKWYYRPLSEVMTIKLISCFVDFNLMGGSGEADSASFSVGDTIVTESMTVYAGWRSEHVPAVLESEIHDAYVSGYTDGTVRPLNEITRAEAVTMLYRLMTDEHSKAIYADKNSFLDIPDSA